MRPLREEREEERETPFVLPSSRRRLSGASGYAAIAGLLLNDSPPLPRRGFRRAAVEDEDDGGGAGGGGGGEERVSATMVMLFQYSELKCMVGIKSYTISSYQRSNFKVLEVARRNQYMKSCHLVGKYINFTWW